MKIKSKRFTFIGMKLMLSFLAFFMLSFLAHGQTFTKPNNSYGVTGNRGSFDSTLYIPTGCGVPTDSTFLHSQGIVTGHGQILKKAAKYYDSCGHHEYVWDPSLKLWHAIDTASGGSGGSGNPNVNLGTGFRLTFPFTNNVRTLNPSNGILLDSTTLANTITFKVDTSHNLIHPATQGFVFNAFSTNGPLAYDNTTGIFSHATSGVGAGSCLNCNLSFDAYGHITAQATGFGPLQFLYPESGISALNDSVFHLGGRLKYNDTLSLANTWMLFIDSAQNGAGKGLKINFGSDATNDMMFRASNGSLARLAAPAHDGMALKRIGGTLTWVDSTAANISGSIAATQVAFGNGANTITGSSSFTYVNTGTTSTLQAGFLTMYVDAFSPNVSLGPSVPTFHGQASLTVGSSNGGLTIGGNNTFIGIAAGAQDTSNFSTVVGSQALAGARTSLRTIAIGANAGLVSNNSTVLTDCIFIGMSATKTTTGSPSSLTNSILIGNSVTTDLNNVAVIGRSDQNIILGVTSPTTDNGSRVQMPGSVSYPIRTSGVNTTLDNTDHTLILTAGGLTITIPAASSATNRIYAVVNESTASTFSANYINFSASSVNTIAANAPIWIQSNGTNWYRIQ